MVEITGSLADTEEVNGVIRDRWRLPALAERQARVEGIANSRLKGRSNPTVRSVNEIEQGDIPGQKIYEVITESSR